MSYQKLLTRHAKRFVIDQGAVDAYRQFRENAKFPAMMDSPVLKAMMTPIEPERVFAEEFFGPPRQLAKPVVKPEAPFVGPPMPWDLRRLFPAGWKSAPYVYCARLHGIIQTR